MPDPTGSNRDEPLDDVLSAGAVLFELDAARAEAWASGLLAEVPDHEALLDGLRAARDDRALAIALALAPMVAPAGDVARELTLEGCAPPEYAGHVGSATAIAAWSIEDPHGTGASVVVEYEHDDGVRHDVLVEIDGSVAVDLLVSPPGVVEVAQAESDRRFRIDELTVTEARERIRAALLATAARPDTPVTDAFLLNRALVAVRVGLPVVVAPVSVDTPPGRPLRPADPEGDAFALATLTSALDLGAELTADAATELVDAAAAVRAAWREGDPEAVSLLADIDALDPDGVADVELLLWVAGAYVRPGSRAGLSPAAADAIDGLEWADWLGAALPLARGGPGTDAAPEQLVRNINRCPEVTTSIPKRDAPAVASAFSCAMPAWRHAGVVDRDDRLTALGAWLLPRALARAWAPAGTGPGRT